jgi:ribosomal protein S18 acetylase RimI-like enzyme
MGRRFPKEVFLEHFKPETVKILSVDGKDAGAFNVDRTDPNRIYITDLEILPEYQGKGIGTQLIKRGG